MMINFNHLEQVPSSRATEFETFPSVRGVMRVLNRSADFSLIKRSRAGHLAEE